MPITPLHFGPGLLLKATAPHHFSWCAFVAANVLIDIEPAAYWIIEGEPHHRFLHTYFGATIVGVVAAAISLKLLPAWVRCWNRQMSPAQARYLGFNTEVRTASVWSGALLGGWSRAGPRKSDTEISDSLACSTNGREAVMKGSKSMTRRKRGNHSPTFPQTRSHHPQPS
jgi:hypothetical protein